MWAPEQTLSPSLSLDVFAGPGRRSCRSFTLVLYRAREEPHARRGCIVSPRLALPTSTTHHRVFVSPLMPQEAAHRAAQRTMESLAADWAQQVSERVRLPSLHPLTLPAQPRCAAKAPTDSHPNHVVVSPRSQIGAFELLLAARAELITQQAEVAKLRAEFSALAGTSGAGGATGVGSAGGTTPKARGRSAAGDAACALLRGFEGRL